jgi:hypothetical protein
MELELRRLGTMSKFVMSPLALIVQIFENTLYCQLWIYNEPPVNFIFGAKMKFTLELPLHKSRAEVWRVFDNLENIKIWQPTLVNFEIVSGMDRQTGTVTKLTYAEGKGEFVLMEKVTFRAEPDRFDVIYENNFADNSVKNTFIALSENETLWKMEVEFKFKTLLMKVVGPFVKKNFAKRNQREMERFKEFVEKP